jgi:pimeloyl-[acyl-carrier protein] methyl ester esterase
MVPPEPFVLLAESFSSPLAFRYASMPPPNLRGLIISAGFVANPFPKWSEPLRLITKPWFFKMKPPRFLMEHFLLGEKAPFALIEKVRGALQNVHPDVMSARVLEVLKCDARSDLARTNIPLLYLHPANGAELPLPRSCCPDV